MFGDDSEEVTPVPIPNTEVKLFSADGSWGFPPVRVGRRQANENQLFISWSFFIFINILSKDRNDLRIEYIVYFSKSAC